MAAILGTVAWHVARVVRRRRWQDAAAYVGSRLLVFVWFGASAAVLARSTGIDMHLHHLYLGAPRGIAEWCKERQCLQPQRVAPCNACTVAVRHNCCLPSRAPPAAGWSLALWAELNHWLSALTLAVGAGIFLQGVGAYSFAPIFQVRPGLLVVAARALLAVLLRWRFVAPALCMARAPTHPAAPVLPGLPRRRAPASRAPAAPALPASSPLTRPSQ